MPRLEPVELLETDAKKIAEEGKIRFKHKGKQIEVNLVHGTGVLQGVYKLGNKIVVLRYQKDTEPLLQASELDEYGSEFNTMGRVGDAGQFGGLLDWRFVEPPYRRSGLGSKLFSMMERHYLTIYPGEHGVVRVGSEERDFIRFLLSRGYEPENKKQYEKVMKEIKELEAKHGEHRPEGEFISHIVLRKALPDVKDEDNLLHFHHIEHATGEGVKRLVFPARRVLTKMEEIEMHKKLKEQWGDLCHPFGRTKYRVEDWFGKDRKTRKKDWFRKWSE
jgi:GNAT superfamily N-acetyltransferase